MTRTRKGLHSTKSVTQDIMDAQAQVDDMAPQKLLCMAIDNKMFFFSATTDNNGNVVYSDLPGCFPIKSYGDDFFCRIRLQVQLYYDTSHEKP